MIPQSLAIIFTRQCNFVCDHCSVEAGPDKHDTISEVNLMAAIDQAYLIPSMKVITFTGGEPTLHLSLLKKGIAYAHEKGFITRVVSNAWWADTYDNALSFLRDLVACGLNEFNVSYDEFHLEYLQKFGGEKNVVNAAKAATDLNLVVVIGMVLQAGAKVTSEYLQQVFREAGIDKPIHFLQDYAFPLGRARSKIKQENFVKKANDQENHGCQEAGRTLVVLPDGKISFCCGHTIFTKAQDLFVIDSLSSGATLGQMMERMQRNALYWVLHLDGPEKIFEKLDIKKEIYNNCEACFYLGTAYRDKLLTLADKKEELFECYQRNVDNINKSALCV